MHQSESKLFTAYGWGVCTWVLILAFQYGYHISVLNQLQSVLTCKSHTSHPYYYGLPPCIPMTDATFSVVTAIYTVGGLVGSISSNLAMDKYGRRGAARWSALATGLGALIMSVAGNVGALLIGRALVGIGAGIGICLGPIYLSEIAPHSIRGSVGVLTQLAIVLGIFLTQLLGLYLATPSSWRFVLLVSAALATAQFVMSSFAAESPSYIGRHGTSEEQKKVAKRLWGVEDPSAMQRDLEVEAQGLLDADAEVEHAQRPSQSALSVPELLKARELRRPLMIVSLAMLSQQLSGINAVLYYSNDILSKALPELGPYISLGVTVVNVFMTFPPIFLIERIGRKKLLQASVAGMLVSHVAVGVGLNTGVVLLSSVAIMTFVTSFAIGLGPVPFVLIPEVSPPHAVSALSSMGLSLNWVANFLVSLVFLPLRNLLAHGDERREGLVFYVFAVVLALVSGALLRIYRG